MAKRNADGLMLNPLVGHICRITFFDGTMEDGEYFVTYIGQGLIAIKKDKIPGETWLPMSGIGSMIKISK